MNLLKEMGLIPICWAILCCGFVKGRYGRGGWWGNMALSLFFLFHAMQQRKGRKREVCTTHGLGSSGSICLALVDYILVDAWCQRKGVRTKEGLCSMNNILSRHGAITHWLCWEISNPPTLFGLPSPFGPTGCFHCCRIRCCMSQLEGRKQTSLSWEIWPLWTRPHSALRGANSDGSEEPLPDVKLGLFLLFGFAIPAKDTIAAATLVVAGGTSLGTVIASRAVGSMDHSHNMALTWLDGNREYDTINQARWRNQYSSTKRCAIFYLTSHHPPWEVHYNTKHTMKIHRWVHFRSNREFREWTIHSLG